jgi:hypothetical protein
MTAEIFALGSAPVSGAGEAVPGSRTFYQKNISSETSMPETIFKFWRARDFAPASASHSLKMLLDERPA